MVGLFDGWRLSSGWTFSHMVKKYLKLNDIDAYKIAFHLSNYLWNVVIKWESFPKRTVGEQFVKAVDSISANIAEGFGRYFKKDKIKFYQYSAGSVKECFDWNEKSKLRLLLTEEEYEHIFSELQRLPEAINRLIKYTNAKLVK
jgi:four helix bundle protein